MKNYNQWNNVKQSLDKRENRPTIKEREIWWCSIGLNIGYEIYGKDQDFVRPVLIIKKFSETSFLGVPMTTSQKKGYYRYGYRVKDKDGFLVFDQLRNFDAKRLMDKIITVPEADFEKIKRALRARLKL